MSLRGWFTLGALCVLLSTGCSHGVRVENPAPVAAGADLDTTEQAILDILPKRGWTAETVEPGRIVAFLSVRQFLLRTEIRYDRDKVTISYIDSDNLEAHEEDGEVYAHRKVTGWMRNLARDISGALATATPASPAASSGGETAPAPSDGAMPAAP